MKRVAIVGGGITGLAAAYELERGSDAEIDLYEAGPRLGGKLQTEGFHSMLVEEGPDCFFTRKPGVLEFVRELGIGGELVSPLANEFSMLVDGRLHRVPRGLVALAAPDPDAIRAATFLSEEGKERALEPRAAEDDDPSIRGFFSDRHGSEFSRLVAEPLLAGTHGGDPGRLSVRALYPDFLSAGGVPRVKADDRAAVTRASLPDTGYEGRSHPSAPVAPPATFLSFRGGMGTLVDALARSLKRTRVRLDAPLDRLPEADRTLVAIPANRAARLLPNVGLEAIPHRSSAITTLALRHEDVGRTLDGTGFLVPPGEAAPLAGATWSSAKWPGRAPDDVVLMRIFEREEADFMPFLRALLDLRGEPVYVQRKRWQEALPQYEIGHLERVAAIEARLPEGVLVAGTSFRGVGVPDCLRQGRDAGRKLCASL